MIITGKKRWFVVVLVSLLSGIMVYVPYLRYNYYDQMVQLFSVYKPIADPENVHSFIGSYSFWYGIVSTIGFPIGGILADKYSEKWLMVAGAVIMGACCFWFGLLPSAASITIIHMLFSMSTSVLIWGAYLKTVRKMGTDTEQGKMFSSSEFVRAIMGTSLGFIGVAALGKAIMPSGDFDLVTLAEQWKISMFINGAIFFVLAGIVIAVLPKNIIGAEQESGEEQEKLNLKSAMKVIKMPGTWLLALLIFFCYSFTSASNGYLGAYMVNVLEVDENTASNFAVMRNYIIAGLSTLAIGFIADKIGSKTKTLGLYLAIATVLTAGIVFTKGTVGIAIPITFVFAVVYSGMRGIYFATLGEVGVPLSLTGVAAGIISLICYLPDVYFASLAGYWLDNFGNKGYDYIWYWVIGCGILGVVTAMVTVGYAKKLKSKSKV